MGAPTGASGARSDKTGRTEETRRRTTPSISLERLRETQGAVSSTKLTRILVTSNISVKEKSVMEQQRLRPSLRINGDELGLLLDPIWNFAFLPVFVAAANSSSPARVPSWLKTMPMTGNSFIDDICAQLAQVAGSRCGRVLLGADTPQQFTSIMSKLFELESDDFMQDVAARALEETDGTNQCLATTYCSFYEDSSRTEDGEDEEEFGEEDDEEGKLNDDRVLFRRIGLEPISQNSSALIQLFD